MISNRPPFGTLHNPPIAIIQIKIHIVWEKGGRRRKGSTQKRDRSEGEETEVKVTKRKKGEGLWKGG